MKTNLEPFKEYLKKKQHTIRTIATYTEIAQSFLQWLEKENTPVEQATYPTILAWMKHRQQQGVTQRTIQHNLGSLRHYYDHLVKEKHIIINPVTGIETKGIKRKILYHLLDPRQLHTLYQTYPDKTPYHKRNKIMMGLLVYQGLKAEELGKLETKDIKIREGKIDIPGSRKSNGRTLLLESHQIIDLYDYLLQVRPQLLRNTPKKINPQPESNHPLFIGDGGRKANIKNYMNELIKKVRTLQPHIKDARQIRTSVITRWLKTHNLREVQYMAGHRYASTTESYLQNDMEGLSEEVNQYHPLQ